MMASSGSPYGRIETEDMDVTPQPLRVIKRSSQTVSDLSRLSKSETDSHLAVGSLAPSPTCNALHVPKQRRTGTSTKRLSSVLGSSSRSTSSHLSSSNYKQPTANSMGKSPASDIHGPYLAASLSHRAFTTGTIEDKRLADSSSTHTSLRKRLLSRVMSGVSAKNHISHAAMERESVIRKPHGDAIEEANPAKDVSHGRPRAARASSLETISTLGADLELALAAFPTPPKSTVTSPTTVSSVEGSHVTPQSDASPRLLIQPSKVAIAGAELRVLPEVNQLSLERSRSVFVAIEMKGVVGPIDQTKNIGKQPMGLDVAVVIDATLFSSPAALLAHCETARFIASLLDTSTDRLAVLTTRPRKTDPPDFNIVSPLSRNTIRIIKSAVDSIVNSTEQPESAAITTAVECAINLLVDNGSQTGEDEPGGDAYGCIFVLTSNPKFIDSSSLGHPLCMLRVLSPGTLPWQASTSMPWNTGKNDVLFSAESIQRKNKRVKSDTLEKILSFAREGRAGGSISDLIVDIEPGPHCSIEAVMGRSEMLMLLPGEVVTALAKVRVGAAPVKGYSLSQSPASKVTSSPATSRDLLEELDMMLGASPAPILVAKLTYRHSLLPAGTRCSTIAAAKIKRPMPGETCEIQSMSSSSQQSENSVEVQKRLAYYLATNNLSPRQAMLSLQEHFNDRSPHSSCTAYIKLIVDELKFQARVLERFDLSSSRTHTFHAIGRETTPRNTYEHFGHGLFAASNYKPQDWLLGVSDEDSNLSSPEKTLLPEHISKKGREHHGHLKADLSRSETKHPAIPRPSVRQAGIAVSKNKRHSGISNPTSKESMDDARKIWGDMRKMSKSDIDSVDIGKPSGASSKYANTDTAKVFKDLTVRNKRSVGTDTLMSLQGRGLGRAKENVAPWL